MALSKQGIQTDMKMTYSMEGCVNGHNFTVKGGGDGNPYEGHQELRLCITMAKGEPVPFAFDILSAAFCYGNRCFTKYPDEIRDYFKQAFPGGLSWERSMAFEDGASAAVTAEISLEGDCFEHECEFVGVNFPANGPVMQKKTQGWETSTEKMTAHGKVVQGNVPMFLKLEGGGRHRCDFRTTYKAKKDVKMPNSHFITHCLVRKGDGNNTELIEDAEARN
uniref:Green fluorescent GFP-like protein n=1 Tax=Eusmilia fastigiata TaxID=214972 RepID=A8CLR1_9CNID|nr:green fluorescent GFP-like protein [Eusmilia fastigiata]